MSARRALAGVAAAAVAFVLAWPAAVAGVGAAAASAVGCSSATTECECVDPSVTLTIPAESAAAVTEVRLAGPACERATPAACTQPAPAGGCAAYRFSAVAAGSCRVEVVFQSGVDAHDLTFVETTGCCAGFYPDPAGTGEIAITPPSGSGPAADGG